MHGMPGETGAGALAAFVATWAAMTAAMMLPSVLPALWRLRAAAPVAGAAYLLVWTALGAALFPIGLALARAGPAAAGAVVLLGGAWQRGAWKARHLAACRARGDGGAPSMGAAAALRWGARLGVDCVRSCAAPTAILLAVGAMDARAMAIVGAAVTAERLAPGGARIARATGLVAVGAGAWLIARAAGLG